MSAPDIVNLDDLGESSFTKRLAALNAAQEAAQLASQSPPASGETGTGITISDRDIVFDCPHCHGELIVDRDAAQMETTCIHCGRVLVVPAYVGPASLVGKTRATPRMAGQTTPRIAAEAVEPVPLKPAAPAPRTADDVERDIDQFRLRGLGKAEIEGKLAAIRTQLKENNSQVTEMTGHVNRTQIQLHRYQIQLEKLKQRNGEINREIQAAQTLLSRI